MQAALKPLIRAAGATVTTTHVDAASPRRRAAEAFIANVFARRYGARVSAFAPHLMLLEQQGRIVAATGWRGAASEPLFLERYLDEPVELAVARLANRPVERARIAEVGNLAAEGNGGSLHVIGALASRLDALGHEWVVFTATQELIGIFTRLGLPLLALAKADPARLGVDAEAWGSYYDTRPVVVAGRIRIALERLGRAA